MRRIDINDDIYLDDHRIGGAISGWDRELKPLSVVPLTISLEIMAEAARALLPGKILVAMKNIRACRWIQIDDRPVTLQIRVIKEDANSPEVKVEIRAGEDEATLDRGSPSIEGIVVFADAYPPAPFAQIDTMKSERPARYTARDMYREKIMFHGPRFQGVFSLDRVGENGIDAVLKVLPVEGFVKSAPRPALATDPFLLDAAGQLVGYWTVECLDAGFVCFPFQVREIDFFAPPPETGQTVRCAMRVAEITPKTLRVNMELYGPDNRSLTIIAGWEDRRFYCSHDLSNFWKDTQKVIISEPWRNPLLGTSAAGAFECYRLKIPETEEIVSWDVCAHLVLGRAELERWRKLGGDEKRRATWLCGRWAVKDAVRAFLQNNYGMKIYPADIEIAEDENGRPVLRGDFTTLVSKVPSLSIAHCRDLAAALVGDNTSGPGIDVEPLKAYGPGFDNIAFYPEEEQLLDIPGDGGREERRLRFWCAKEAVGKALGRGLSGGPRDLAVVAYDAQTGRARLSLRGRLKMALPELSDERIAAYTFRDGDYIGAVSLGERMKT